LDYYIYAFGITLLKNSFKILESAEASIRLDLPALPLDLHFIILIKDIINSFFFFCYFFSFVNNCKFVNNNKKNGVNLPAC